MLQRKDSKTLYQILGVSADSSASEIKSAFLSGSELVHPDVAEEKDAEKAGEEFRQLAAAYEV